MSHDGLFQLGMGTDLLNAAQTEEFDSASASVADESRLDFFIEKDGTVCAGAHLIIDLFDADRLDDIAHIEKALTDCVDAAGATLLHIHLHPFEPNGGVSGVAVLAESHISIHSWPERGYAALDVFMCGDARPEACIDILKDAFQPATLVIACEGAAAMRIQHETGAIVERVNAYLGFAAIGRIRIVQKPVAARQTPARPAARALDEEETGRIDRLVAGIEDEDLRASLASLGRAVIARRR
jgi:S-adenosylmethionine decarboxylase